MPPNTGLLERTTKVIKTPTTIERIERSQSAITTPKTVQTTASVSQQGNQQNNLRQGLNTLRTTDQLRANQPSLIAPNGVSYGRYPAGITDADVEGTAAFGKLVLGLYDQLGGSNPLGATNTRRENQRQVFTPAENFGYEIGRQLGRQGQTTTTRIANQLDNLWRNKPTFEIPQVKIPEVKIPQIPKIELPKLPEIKVPELPKIPQLPQVDIPKIPKIQNPIPKLPSLKPNPIPKIKPTPKTLTEKIRELDPVGCGGIRLKLARVRKIFDFIDNGQGGLEAQFTEATLQEYISAIKSNPGNWTSDNPPLDIDIIEGGGQTGAIYEESGYFYLPFVRGRINQDGSRGDLILPFLEKEVITIEITDSQKRASEVLDIFQDWEAYDFLTRQPEKDGCYLPPPKSDNPPPNPPKKKEMNCNCEQMEEMIKLILRRIGKFPFQAELTENIKKEIPDVAGGIKIIIENPVEPIASIPLSWPIRNEGNRPQMVLHCGERYTNKNGKIDYKSAMYPITVPHWRGTPNDKPKLPTYRKGNWEGIYVLTDNSKVTINAANEAECLKILNAIKPWIKKEMQEGAYFKGGKINVEIKSTIVKPIYGRFFGSGQKKSKPDWRVDFP